MTSRRGWAAALLVLALLVAGGGYAYHVLHRVVVLRIATGPAGGFGSQIATALVHLVNLDHPNVRVTATAFPSDAAALEALRTGKADVAVSRSDAGESVGLTVAILRHDVALFVVPHGSKIESLAALHGAAVAIVGSSPRDVALLDAVKAEYGLPASPAPIALSTGEIAEALREKKVQAIFVVGAVGGDTIARSLAAVRDFGKGVPKILPIDQSTAIVKRNHILETVDLPKGVFQGSPSLPDDDTSSLGVSTRIFATSRMADAVAAELTRILLTDKPRVASLLPKTAVVEPPETDKLNASLPIHPGTAAYLSGNQPSLSDEAQNALYWVGIIGSLFASTAAALTALVRMLMPRRPTSTLRLLDLWVAAREAGTSAALHDVETEVDALLQDTLRKQAADKGEELKPAFPLLVDQVKRAIDRRRTDLASQPAQGHGPVPVHLPDP